ALVNHQFEVGSNIHRSRLSGQPAQAMGRNDPAGFGQGLDDYRKSGALPFLLALDLRKIVYLILQHQPK
ncbi:MAG TPA: hypothetical protein PLS42_09330, partial [Candidatus Competibacter denitrificans]|nr:hypothetical protein [Candidatus Competibacter denitrificans]